MPKVYNIHNSVPIPPGAVYVGRGSSFGNPFMTGRDGSRDIVVAKFEKYVKANAYLRNRIKRELAGKDLICFCVPQSCHATYLLEVANGKQN